MEDNPSFLSLLRQHSPASHHPILEDWMGELYDSRCYPRGKAVSHKIFIELFIWRYVEEGKESFFDAIVWFRCFYGSFTARRDGLFRLTQLKSGIQRFPAKIEGLLDPSRQVRCRAVKVIDRKHLFGCPFSVFFGQLLIFNKKIAGGLDVFLSHISRSVDSGLG